MKSLETIKLDPRERRAIKDASDLLKKKFLASKIILFGSKARGDADAESDIDLLILLPKPLSWQERKAINDSLYDIELAYDVVISPLLTTLEEWDEGPFSVLPIREDIAAQGVLA